MMLMKKFFVLTFCAGALAACSAPQGKKYSETKRELPAIALPPAEKHPVVHGSDGTSIVAVQPGGTLTLFLSANRKSNYRWRLSQMPDPTVLQLVTNEFVPAAESARGEEKWVFKAVGEGEIDLRLWYTSQRREQFGSAPVFACVVAVVEKPVPVASGPARGRSRAEVRRSQPKAQPRPNSESAPFNEPVFRSSRMLPGDERDGGQEQS